MRSGLRAARFVTHWAVAVGVVAVGLLGTVMVRPVEAQSADAHHVISLVNSVRASIGSPPVGLDSALSAVAQSWAGTIAASGAIAHNPSLGAQVSGWSSLAENVGMGQSVDNVHHALTNSPQHYANMTNAAYNLAGAGVASSGGQIFVVQVFMQGEAAAPEPPPPPPPPPPEPEPEPEPAAEPEPEPVRRSPTPAPPVVSPDPEPVPPAPLAVPPVPVAGPSDPSQWLALVLEQLQVLDGTLG